MSKESARTFLTEGLWNDKVIELLHAYGKPETEADEVAVYLAVAKEAGFDFTEAELSGAIEELDQERLGKTEADVLRISELPEEELKRVVGGTLDYHRLCESNFFDEDRACKDTYRDMENCWVNDGCDLIYHDYWDYVCKRVHFCAGGYNGA